MLYEFFHSLPGFIRDVSTVSDKVFQNLLGVLVVIAVLRIMVPLHKIMAADLAKRNKVVDLAEADGCSEFDVFVRAFEYYHGSRTNKEKAKGDFVAYICNWPDNYILPFYVRRYLEMRYGGTKQGFREPVILVDVSGKILRDGVAKTG